MKTTRSLHVIRDISHRLVLPCSQSQGSLTTTYIVHFHHTGRRTQVLDPKIIFQNEEFTSVAIHAKGVFIFHSGSQEKQKAMFYQFIS